MRAEITHRVGEIMMAIIIALLLGSCSDALKFSVRDNLLRP